MNNQSAEFVLDQVSATLLKELDATRQEYLRAAQACVGQAQAIITLKLREAKLEGSWDISPDCTKLIQHPTEDPAKVPRRVAEMSHGGAPDITRRNVRKR